MNTAKIKPNHCLADRCLCLMNAVNALSALGIVVRRADIDTALPRLWVYCAPALYRLTTGGPIDDLGRNHTSRVKSIDLLGVEVRWLEPIALARAKQAAHFAHSPHTNGVRHARA